MAGTPNHQNGKPNYLSIMSYSWSFTGVKIGETFKIDFSPFPGTDEAADAEVEPTVTGVLFREFLTS